MWDNSPLTLGWARSFGGRRDAGHAARAQPNGTSSRKGSGTVAGHAQLPRGAGSGATGDGLEASALVLTETVVVRRERDGGELAPGLLDGGRRRVLTPKWDARTPVPVQYLPPTVYQVLYTIKFGARYLPITVPVLTLPRELLYYYCTTVRRARLHPRDTSAQCPPLAAPRATIPNRSLYDRPPSLAVATSRSDLPTQPAGSSTPSSILIPSSPFHSAMSGPRTVRADSQSPQQAYDLALYKSESSSDSECASPRLSHAHLRRTPTLSPTLFLSSDDDNTPLRQLLPRPPMDDRDDIVEAPPYGTPRSPGWAPASPAPMPDFQPRRERRAPKRSASHLAAAAQYVPARSSDAASLPPNEAPSSLPPPLPPTGTAPRTVEAGSAHSTVLPPPPIAPLPPAGTTSPAPPSGAVVVERPPYEEVAAPSTRRDSVRSLSAVLPVPSTPRWLRSGVASVRAMLPGSSMDHRRRRSRRRARGRKPPMTVDEYIRRNLLDSARFRAIPADHAILTPSDRGAVAQHDRESAWQARWRHVPCRTPASSGCDLFFVRCEGEEVYHAALLNLFGRYCRYERVAPNANLVAFPRPFDTWYSIADRARWGEDSARESRLRWRRVDNFFHMWHSTEFFSVPSAARRGLYPALPPDWSSLEAPEHLCVPTPSVMAYVSAHWLPRGRAEVQASQRTRSLVHSIMLSEWAVLALLCFLRAAREGLPFFTKCHDPRLAARNGEPIGERGVLFRLSAGLIALIRSVGVAAILDGTAYHAEHAEQLLSFSETLDWAGRPDFVWFSWDRGCTLEMPPWVGASADVGASAAAVGDMNTVLDAATGNGAGEAVAQSRARPSDTGATVAAPIALPPSGSARLGSAQSDSPKGVGEAQPPLNATTGGDGPPQPPSARSPEEIQPIGTAHRQPPDQPATNHRHTSAVTGAEGTTHQLVMAPPSASPTGRNSAERLREEAALAALQYACSFEGASAPSTVEQALLQARDWMHRVRQLEKTNAELRASAKVAMRERVEHHAKLRAVQDVLAVVGQRLAGPPMASPTVGASRPSPDTPDAGPPSKRARRS